MEIFRIFFNFFFIPWQFWPTPNCHFCHKLTCPLPSTYLRFQRINYSREQYLNAYMKELCGVFVESGATHRNTFTKIYEMKNVWFFFLLSISLHFTSRSSMCTYDYFRTACDLQLFSLCLIFNFYLVKLVPFGFLFCMYFGKYFQFSFLRIKWFRKSVKFLKSSSIIAKEGLSIPSNKTIQALWEKNSVEKRFSS